MKVYDIDVDVSGYLEVNDWGGGLRDAPIHTRLESRRYLVTLCVAAEDKARADALARSYDFANELWIGVCGIDIDRIEEIPGEKSDCEFVEFVSSVELAY